MTALTLLRTLLFILLAPFGIERKRFGKSIADIKLGFRLGKRHQFGRNLHERTELARHIEPPGVIHNAP